MHGRKVIERLTKAGYVEKEDFQTTKQFGKNDHIQSATMTVRSYAGNLYEAAMLNSRVKNAMRDSITLKNVSRCKLNSDYNYTDTEVKKYRYQAVFNITFY